jgi:hypothetical protein
MEGYANSPSAVHVLYQGGCFKTCAWLAGRAFQALHHAKL